MKRRISVFVLCALVAVAVSAFILTAPAKAAEELTPYETTASTTPEEVLSAWATGNYSYIKLGAGLELTLTDGDIVVDLAGNDLTVNGSGSSGNASAADELSPTVRSLLLMLLAFGRGLRKCD